MIREPWLKESRDGYYIRVDSPSDVDIWPTSSYAPVNHLDVKARLNAARTQGASCFVKGDFVGAINAYEEGLLACRGRRQPDAAVEETIVHLNAAAAYLKLGLPGKAMSHMKQCRVDDLNDKQKQKHVYRKASALYNLGLHRECHVFLSTEVDVQDASSAEIAQLRDAASQRRYEALSGKYDWSFLYTQLEKGNSPDMADYTGPVQIQQIAGKENGLIAAEKAKPGDLLLVCNPIAVAGNGTPITNSTLGINCMTKELSTPSVMQVIETLYDKMRDWHGTGAKLRSMFAGIDFKRSAYTPSGDFNRTDGFLNAGQVEALVTRNAFRPRCITTALVEEDADTVQRSERDQIDKLTASCGLYHLPSMINHSCIGNATFYFFESVIVVRATRNIEKGEEILFS